MFMYQKSMFDCYYCIKTFFPLENFGEFACTYNGAENAASRAKTNVIVTVHFTDDDVSFYDGPGMLVCKTAKPCINSM